jgi:hypothetical protein
MERFLVHLRVPKSPLVLMNAPNSLAMSARISNMGNLIPDAGVVTLSLSCMQSLDNGQRGSAYE